MNEKQRTGIRTAIINQLVKFGPAESFFELTGNVRSCAALDGLVSMVKTRYIKQVFGEMMAEGAIIEGPMFKPTCSRDKPVIVIKLPE